MAIKRPDIYEHNNPNLPIADSDFVKGGIRSAVQNLSNLYSLSNKAIQLKQHSTQVYVSGENKFYLLKDISNIGNSNGWAEINFGGGSTPISNVVYTTGNIDIFDQKRFENATNIENAPFLYSGLGKYTEDYFTTLFSGGSGIYNSPAGRNSVIFLNFNKDGEYDINLPSISGSVINDNIKYIISNTYKENVSINFYDWAFTEILTGNTTGDLFGYSVATNSDGSVLMMGGPLYDPNGVTNAGGALIYTGNAVEGWTLKQSITGDTIIDQFGSSVAINSDGSVLMMGGHLDDPNGLTNAGGALIYTGNSVEGWVLKQRITGDTAGDQFGYSVATNFDGSVLMMGGPLDDPNGITDAGAALIYTGNAVEGWVLKQRITGDTADDQFGYSVATNFDGNILMIGGRLDDPNSIIDAGAALIYTGNAVGGWTLKQRITGNIAGDQFGYSVATNFDGSVLMMGGPLDDPNGVTNAGAALIYTGNAVEGWTLKQRITGSDISDQFGYSVATNSDGSVLMMGGNLNDPDGVIDAGATLIYTGNAVEGWTLKQRITGSNIGDQFGISVATNSNGSVLMMGGIGIDVNALTNVGAALVYNSPSIEFLYQPDFTLNFKTSGVDENQNYTEPFNLESFNSFVENDSISFYFDENGNWTILDKIQNNFLPEHTHEIEDIAGMPDLENIVYTTGNQTISGIKTFSTQISVNNILPILTGSPVVLNPLYIDVYNGILGYNISLVPSYGLDWKSGILSSNNGAEGWKFTKRPTLNGTGVLLSGEAVAPLVDIDNITNNFTFNSTHNGKVLYVSGNTDITGSLPPFGLGLNTFSAGYNVSVVQIGSGNVIFNDGGINGAYFRNRLNLNKTAGKYAVASVLRLDQDEFLLYGDLI